jgi:predicted RND superfamily exporter protein
VNRILRLVPSHPRPVLTLVAALTLLAGTQIVDVLTGDLRLVIDPSVDSLLPEEDEDRRFYDHVRRLFGSDETLLVALVDDDVFDAENLRRIRTLTSRIEQVDGVHHVLSLANALTVRSRDGDIEIAPFFDEVPDDPAARARLRRQALADPLYAGNLVSRDGRAAFLLVYLMDRPERELLARGTHREIARIAEAASGDASAWVSGGIYLKAETSRALLADLVRTVPLTALVVGLIAFLSFRTARGVLVPLGTVLIALVWTLGAVAAVGGSINLVTAVVPPLVLVVGFAYSIHVVSEFYDVLRERRSSHETAPGAVAEALERVSLPVLLTGVTTAAGLLSLATNRIGAIQQFGILSTLGVVAAMLAALTFTPAALELFPTPARAGIRPERGAVDRWLEWLAAFDLRRRRAILLTGAAVAVVALVGLTQIRVTTDFVGTFSPEHPVRRHFDAVAEHLEGSNAFYVILEAPYRDAFTEPANLRALEGIQEWLAAQPEIARSTSLADYVRVINRGFHDDDPAHFAIPDDAMLVSQLLYFAANDEMDKLVDSRFQSVAILVRSETLDSSGMAGLVRRIEDHLEDLPEPLKATVTGNGVLLSRTIDDIALGQALSLGTAFLIIFVILCLLFTSVRVGFIALIPNALPVLAYFGVLGLSGVSLNATTGLVACLVLGIAVDDTIHFLARFNAAAHRTADEARGVIEALRSVGRPVTYTSGALCLGFLVLTTSDLRNQAEFGALAALTLAFAWLVDVTFTPALAVRMRIVTLWDVLSLDLGDDPHHSIPLFEGLKKTQARIVALLGRIVTVAKGEQLIRAGDSGDEMFVVIEGELLASLETERGRVEFGRLGRGRVVGEVALFHGRRTADVHALSDVRLLRLTEADLERIRRRYPRTGARLYRNVSKILAHHVATTTDRVR